MVETCKETFQKIYEFPLMVQKLSFLGMTKDYVRYSTDAIPLLGEVTAIQVLGFALGRKVVHKIQPDYLYHNTYVLLMADSTFGRKNTVQKLFKKLLPKDTQFSNESSPEAFLEEIAEQNSGIAWMGEFSKVLKGIKGGNYMATFSETWNDMHCCEPFKRKLRSQKGKKVEFFIEKPYLSVNTTITPPVLKKYLSKEMAAGGFLARFIVVSGKVQPKARGRLNDKVFGLMQNLKANWEFVARLDKTDAVFELSDEALKYYNDVVEKEAYGKEFDISKSNAGRYVDYVLTFADILLVNEALGVLANSGKNWNQISTLVELVTLVKLVENIKNSEKTKCTNPTNSTNLTNSLIVQTRHVKEAWLILKQCLVFVKQIVEYVDMGKALAKVREYIKKFNGEIVYHSDVLRMTNISADELERAVKTLQQRKEIVRGNDEPKPGRDGTYSGKSWYKWMVEQ